MSTQHIPLPCRYFHTAQGCPYGVSCKFDHFSNNPSYFNYIKQKLHQISKPQKQNKSIANLMLETMQECITQIINKQFSVLYQEIAALKSSLAQQTKLIQNNNNKTAHNSDASFTKQFNKITKLLKKNHKCIISTKHNKTSINDKELNDVCHKLRKQLKQLKSDKKTFETQIYLSDTMPTQTRKKWERTNTKCTQSRSQSPFANMEKYDNIFGFEQTNPKSEQIAPVTMEQIVALPMPPKTKPKPNIKNIKPETKVIAMVSDNSEITLTKTVKKQGKTAEKSVKSAKNKKLKRKNYRKKQHSKSKKKSQKRHNTQRKRNDRESKEVLPMFSHMNDNDWYQIIKSDSSEDETNMTSEDVQKLDMLDSI